MFATDAEPETGEVMMTYGDFLHTMTPYNNYEMVDPDHTKAYVETYCAKQEFFKYVDTDKSGQISFVEFCLLLTIYQVTAAQLRRVFKKYPKQQMTKAEFSDELRSIRKKTMFGKKIVGKQKIDARKIASSDETFLKANHELTDAIFGDKTHISLKDMIDLKLQMNRALWHYEFSTYNPDENDTIDMEAWLRSVIVCMSGLKVDRYVKQAAKVKEAMGENHRVTFNEYMAFQYLLCNVDVLKSKLVQYRYLDFDMLVNLMAQFSADNDFCKQNKVKISEDQTTAFFMLLDLDESGELEQDELMDVVMDRQMLCQDKDAQVREDAIQTMWDTVGKAKKILASLVSSF